MLDRAACVGNVSRIPRCFRSPYRLHPDDPDRPNFETGFLSDGTSIPTSDKRPILGICRSGSVPPILNSRSQLEVQFPLLAGAALPLRPFTSAATAQGLNKRLQVEPAPCCCMERFLRSGETLQVFAKWGPFAEKSLKWPLR